MFTHLPNYLVCYIDNQDGIIKLVVPVCMHISALATSACKRVHKQRSFEMFWAVGFWLTVMAAIIVHIIGLVLGTIYSAEV